MVHRFFCKDPVVETAAQSKLVEEVSKRYRIVTNGDQYFIQEKGILWGWNFVRYDDGIFSSVVDFSHKEFACMRMEEIINANVRKILQAQIQYQKYITRKAHGLKEVKC